MTTRRRLLTIAAAALAFPAHAQDPQVWQGQSLGAAGTITLAGVGPTRAGPIFRKVEATLAQIEAQFSLYRDSALARLNRDGRLPHPAPEVHDLFTLAGQVHTVTDGAFDPSVQPLWRAIATGGDTRSARALIGWPRVTIAPDEIALAPGMQLTFNGIAQGHAADRIAALLRAEGLTDVLIDIGEIVALGHHPDDRAWQAGIALPAGQDNGRQIRQLPLTDRALATSSPLGTRIGAGQPHILHPDGRAPRWRLASVSAPQAAVADALSTAFCLMDRNAIARALTAFPQARLEALA